ncbi:MAG: glycosyltransferase family 39 protein [Caldilinea sp.]
MNRHILNRVGAAAVLFCLLLLPRLPGLTLAVSPDEPKWLARSANFYYALAHHDWPSTFQIAHPGVSVMYVGMTSFLALFPKLATQAPAPFDWESKATQAWLQTHLPVSPLTLLIAGRWAVILLITFLLMLMYFPLRTLLGKPAALLAILFVGWSPFGLSLTQRLHPDSLLAIFLLLSLSASLAWLSAGRALRYLLLSAGAGGLAGLTKTPAIFLVATLGLLMAIDWWRSGRSARQGGAALGSIALWGGVALVLFVALWPALWVQPLQTLAQILAEMSVHAEGHTNPNFFWGQRVEDPGWLFYPVALLFRSTPATLLGGIAAGVLWATRGAPLFRQPTTRSVLLGSLLFALLFTAGMTLGGKKSDRYALPALLALDLIGAIGWYGLAQLVWQQPWLARAPRQLGPVWGGAVALCALHGSFAAYHAPYYFTYFNPLVGGTATAPQMLVIGWGEGLDQAARWLNEYGQGQARPALAAYNNGPFSYFYQHDAISYASNLQRDWLEADYAVTYANQWQRQLPDAQTLEFFAAQTPVYVYRFRGLELAQVYDLVQTLPPPNPKVDSQRIIDFGGTLRLLKHDLSPLPSQPGESGEVALYLKKIQTMEQNVSALLRLYGPDGSEVWRSEGWPYGSPTREWPLREVRRDAHLLTLPSTLPDGLYRLTLAFYESDTLDLLPVTYPGNRQIPAGGTEADLLLIQVGIAPTPASTGQLPSDFGASIRLAGYTLPSTLAAGQTLPVTLVWQSLHPTAAAYTVFVHVVDPAGQLVAQQDRSPQAPTQLWTPGMTLKETYTLSLPASLQAGEFSVRVGLYDASGTRLPTDSSEKNDFVEIGRLQVD